MSEQQAETSAIVRCGACSLYWLGGHTDRVGTVTGGTPSAVFRCPNCAKTEHGASLRV
jgi:hypothetical protein